MQLGKYRKAFKSKIDKGLLMHSKQRFFFKNDFDLYTQLVQLSHDIRVNYHSSNYDQTIEIIAQPPSLYSPELYLKYKEDHKLFNEKIAFNLIAEETNLLLKPINEKRKQSWTIEEWKDIGYELA